MNIAAGFLTWVEGVEQGPFSYVELCERQRAGQFGPMTLVREEGAEEWFKLDDIHKAAKGHVPVRLPASDAPRTKPEGNPYRSWVAPFLFVALVGIIAGVLWGQWWIFATGLVSANFSLLLAEIRDVRDALKR